MYKIKARVLLQGAWNLDKNRNAEIRVDEK